VDELGVVQDVGTPKRDPEKESKRRDALVEGRNARTTCRQMKLIATHVFETRGVGRAAKEGSEVLDPLKVVMLSLRANLRIVVSSIMRCRSGLMALPVMGDAPVLMKVANPSSQDRTPRGAILLAV
jgi:hypothetical protein